MQHLQVFYPEGEEIEENCVLEIDFFRTQEERMEGMKLMNAEIEGGQSWPFDVEFEDFKSFSQYFLSHDAFVVKVKNFHEMTDR